MKNNNNSNIEIDIQLLQQLRKEHATNLYELKNRLRKRRNRRILGVSLSSVAAIIAVSMLVFNLNSDEVVMDNLITTEQLDIKTPLLIFPDGNRVDLLTDESTGTLMLGDLPKPSQQQKIVSRFNRLIMPSGYCGTFTLEDGTEVTLNACSELSYPEHFIGDQREVFLKGEGYFKVKKSDKPFIVSTTHADIKVYGTEFNINSNRRGVLETLLINGRVGVTSKNNKSPKEVIMEPNELFTLQKESGLGEVTVVDATSYISWKKGVFIFNYDSMVDVMDEISMWYGVKFDFDAKKIAEKIVTINIDRTVTLDSILDIISEMADVKFIKEGRDHFYIEVE